MADVFKKIAGIMGNFFKVGGTGGPGIKNNSGVVEVRNTGDTDFAVARVANIPTSGSNIADVINLLNARGRGALIEFSFNGASAPGAGTNTDKFGFCHTTGGGYTAGDVVYDTGSALQKIQSSVVQLIITTSAVSGTISLNANGVYANQGGMWTLKGDGSASSTGLRQTIEIDIDFNNSGDVSSTKTLADGDVVLGARVVTSTVFNGTAPTVAVKVNGTADIALMATGDSDLTTQGEYHDEESHEVGASNAGPITATVTPDASTAGAAKIVVDFASPHQ